MRKQKFVGIDELLRSYEERKGIIRKRLSDFTKTKTDEELFAEMAFCILTPQSKAKPCWNSIEELIRTGLLQKGNETEIKKYLCCRFHNNKASYIVEAREFFNKNREKIKEMMSEPLTLREYLVHNIKGFGYKEASHFLRNIGLGKNIAILDRHILKNLVKYGAIKEIPKTLTRKKYLEIEKTMRDFSESVGIPIDELDLLFWSEESGEVFK